LRIEAPRAWTRTDPPQQLPLWEKASEGEGGSHPQECCRRSGAPLPLRGCAWRGGRSPCPPGHGPCPCVGNPDSRAVRLGRRSLSCCHGQGESSRPSWPPSGLRRHAEGAAMGWTAPPLLQGPLRCACGIPLSPFRKCNPGMHRHHSPDMALRISRPERRGRFAFKKATVAAADCTQESIRPRPVSFSLFPFPLFFPFDLFDSFIMHTNY